MSARRWCRAWSIAARRAAGSCRSTGDGPLVTGASIAGGGRALGQLLSTAVSGALALIRLDRLAEALAAGANRSGPARPGHGREAGLGAVRGAGRRRGLIVTRRADGAQCTKP